MADLYIRDESGLEFLEPSIHNIDRIAYCENPKKHFWHKELVKKVTWFFVPFCKICDYPAFCGYDKVKNDDDEYVAVCKLCLLESGWIGF